MATFNKADFWEELNATEEAFVRRKHAMGGYSPAKHKLVSEWLGQRDIARQQQNATAHNNATNRAAFWTLLTACAAVLGAAANIAELFK